MATSKKKTAKNNDDSMTSEFVKIAKVEVRKFYCEEADDIEVKIIRVQVLNPTACFLDFEAEIAIALLRVVES